MKKRCKHVVLLLLGVLCFTLLPFNVKAANSIDIYLIAGQSNAAGFTRYDSSVLESMDTRFTNGFENIYYAGTAANPSGDYFNGNHKSVQPVKAGQGGHGFIGPELGIAKALSGYYNPSTGKYAGIIKYAAGGTCLRNVLTGQNQAAGNWVSPSYEATLTTGVTKKTGGLYDNFLIEVENQLNAYRKAGFEPVIKGFYWMQGESDRGYEKEYVKAFTYFVSDIRRDLEKISGQDMENLPILVGEISRSFGAATSTELAKNQKFIEMQNTLPSNINCCYIIKNSVYDINTADGVVGTDKAHWNYKDCIAIGQLVGNQFVQNLSHTHVYNQHVIKDCYLKTAGTCTSKAVYYSSCTCGARSSTDTFEGTTAEHVYDCEVKAGKYLKTKGTCTTKAVYYKSCACGKKHNTETFLASKVSHNYTWEVEKDIYLKTEGDCHTKPIYYKSCICGAHGSKTFEGSSYVHNFGEWTIKEEATADKDGVMERKCKECDYTQTKKLAFGEDINEEELQDSFLDEITSEGNWIWLLVGLGIVLIASVVTAIRVIYLKKKSTKVEEEL